MKTIIGIDLGPTSIGIASINENGRLLTKPLIIRVKDNYDEKSGISSNTDRCEFRSLRRRIKRHYVLKHDFLVLCKKNGINLDENFPSISLTNEIHDLKYDILFKNKKPSINEVCSCLYHYLQKRGNNFSGIDLKDKLPIEYLKKRYDEQGTYKLTPFKKKNDKKDSDSKKQNNDDTIDETAIEIKHDDYLREINKFLELTQNNDTFSKEFSSKYLELFNRRRSYEYGPGNKKTNTPFGTSYDNANKKENEKDKRIFDKLIGKCSIFSEEYRSLKASASFQLFRVLEWINNHNFEDNSTGEIKKINLLEKINFINFIIKNSFKSLTNKKIFKEFKFSPIPNGPKDKDFDIFKSLFHINFFLPYTKSKNLFIENENTFDFETLGTLNDFSDKMNKNIDLSYFDDNDINNKKDKKEDAKSEEKENKKPLKLSNICKEENKLKNLQDLCNEYQIKEEELAEYINKNGKAYFSNGSLSIKALNIILPELLNESLNLSNILNDKQKQTRLFVNKANKKNKKEILKNINNPNVNKVSKLCLKVIKKYISENEDKIDLNDVQFIIEMARDFNTKEERDKIYKINEENNKKNIKIQDELDKGKFKISGTNILKYKLFEEQDGECPYSGEKINKDKLQNYDIDHIYAYSWSGDDSFNNKVLVTKISNREKANKTPASYFDGRQEELKESKSWKSISEKNKNKYRRLIDKEKFFSIIAKREGFIGRNLSDTRYICTSIKQLLENQFDNAKIEMTNGKITTKIKGMIKYKINDQDSSKELNNESNSEKENEKVAIKDYYKNKWEKDRKIFSHHGIDAVAIAYSGFISHQIQANIDKEIISDKSVDIFKDLKKKMEDEEIYEKLQLSNDFLFYKPVYKKHNKSFFKQTLYSLTKKVENEKEEWYLNEKINIMEESDKNLLKYFEKNQKDVNMYHSHKQLFEKLQEIFFKYYDSSKDTSKTNSFQDFMNEYTNDCKEEEIKKSKQTFPFLEFEFNNQKIKIKNMKIRTKTDKETYCLASGQHSQNGNNYAGYKSFPFKKLYIFENEEGKKTKIDYLNYSVLCEKSKENKKGEEFEDSLKEKFENIKNKEHICIRKGEKIRLRNEINAEVKISGIIFNKDEIYEVSGFNGNFELKSLYKDFGKRVFVSISKFLQTFEIINIDLLGTIYKDNKKETIIKKWKEKGLIK